MCAQEVEAVHARHDQIEGHHIRLKLFDHFERFDAIARGAYYLDERAARQHLPHDFAYIGRIVYYQHADDVVHGHLTFSV